MNGILSKSSSEICYNGIESFPKFSVAEELLLKYNSLSFAGNSIDCGDVTREWIKYIFLVLGVLGILGLFITIKLSIWLVKKMKFIINP